MKHTKNASAESLANTKMVDLRSQIDQWSPSQGVITGIGMLTPQLAVALMADESFTRGHVKTLISRYSKHMVNNNWHLTGETVILNCDKRLVDGHNRCMSVIATGKTIPLVVVVGISHAAVPYIDCGGARSMAQRCAIANGESVKKAQTKIVTRMMQTDRLEKAEIDSARKYPQHHVVADIRPEASNEFKDTYSEGVDFVIEHFVGQRDTINHASVQAAIAKAFYHTRKYKGGRARLARFCEVLRTCMVLDESDQAAVALRKQLLEVENPGSARNHNRGAEVYLRTAYYLDKFMRGEPVYRAGIASADPFPLSRPSKTFDAHDCIHITENIAAAMRETVCALEPVEA